MAPLITILCTSAYDLICKHFVEKVAGAQINCIINTLNVSL